ncbi:MAG: pilus assembly protein PilP [Bdellovibrionota bacterium]
MYKILIAVMLLGLFAAAGYYRFSAEPLSPRASLDAGIKQVKEKTSLSPEQESLLKIQLAISDYMAANGTAPSSLDQLVPKYFDQLPKNPATGEPFPYKLEGKMPRLGAQVNRAAAGSTGKQPTTKPPTSTPGGVTVTAEDGFVNPNTMQVDDFTYDKTGKRDPFEPFDLSATPEPDVTGNSLTAYTLGQLRLTAVVVGPTGEKKGLVEDSTGRGYTVSVNDRIGKEGGTVVSIETDRLKIVVSKVDFTGKEVQNVVEMKINQAGPGGQTTANAKKPAKGK